MGKIWFLSWFRLRKTEMLKEDRISAKRNLQSEGSMRKPDNRFPDAGNRDSQQEEQ